MVLEIDRFNLELNLPPAPLAGRPFAAMASELDQALGIVRRAAAWHGGRVVMVGNPPHPRARRPRGRQQLVPGAPAGRPRRFADHFNAAQLATGPVLAVAGNSPTFLGHRLWQETRVALFKQAIDDRDAAGRCSRRISRVAFGTGWVRSGPLELLEESVRLHEPVLPVVGPEQPLDRLDRGDGVPALEELRLHQGTVWRWNRAIYDPAGGGHLRIELRALPSGPTVTDLLANAAFLLGLTLALAGDAGTLVRRFPFQQAHHNFYRAAQFGPLPPCWSGTWTTSTAAPRSTPGPCPASQGAGRVQVERSWRVGSRKIDSTSSITRVVRSAKRPGRNGARRPSAVPSATSLATRRPSTGARVTPLWLTARYSWSSQGRGPTIGSRSAGMAR